MTGLVLWWLLAMVGSVPMACLWWLAATYVAMSMGDEEGE